MKTPEEPQQPFESWSSFREIPYDQLPPNLKKTVDAAFTFLDNDSPSWNQQTFTSTSNSSFERVVSSEPRPQYWTKWDYSDEEWKLFDRLDWGRARNSLVITAILIALGSGAILSFLLLGFLAVPGGDSDVPFLGIFFFAIFSFLTFILTFVFAGRQFQEARKRHQARKTGPQRVTIGTLSSLNDQGVWIAGSFVPLQETFLSLNRIKTTERPPLLHLHRKHLGIRQSSWYDTIRVLVPTGHEAEAAQLAERFRTETIASQKKSYTPPEP